MPALIHLYETFSEALHAMQELEAEKVPAEDISLIVMNGQGGSKTHKASQDHEPQDEGKVDHSARCKSLGAMRLHHLAGLAPVAGCGWMVTGTMEKTPAEDLDAKGNGLNSAHHTGLAACLMENGLTKEYAETYIEGIKRGSTLLGVRASPALETVATRIMREDHQPLDPRMRGRHYAAKRMDLNEITKAKGSDRASAMLIGGLKNN